VLTERENIIAQLRQDILRMQGQRPATDRLAGKLPLGSVLDAFPHSVFPTGAIHEYISATPAAMAATTGFITGILSGLMRNSGPCIWISPDPVLFPPGFSAFDVKPDRILFVQARKERDICWAMETCLQMDGLSAVVGELPGLGFTASRRLQLAVEKSGVTGFVLRPKPRSPHHTACVSRWQVKPMTSYYPDDFPGVGVPCWQVELLKIRGGRPGAWRLAWMNGSFQPLPDTHAVTASSILRKIG